MPFLQWKATLYMEVTAEPKFNIFLTQLPICQILKMLVAIPSPPGRRNCDTQEVGVGVWNSETLKLHHLENNLPRENHSTNCQPHRVPARRRTGHAGELYCWLPQPSRKILIVYIPTNNIVEF